MLDTLIHYLNVLFMWAITICGFALTLYMCAGILYITWINLRAVAEWLWEHRPHFN